MAKRTMTKRFYPTAAAVNSNCLCLLSEAIEKATRRLEREEHISEIYIVEVVRVVRRSTPPIVVEEIRK